MKLLAHRGFAGEHPENTLAAVRAAATVADAVEVDVRRCGSGQLVVLHDETVDRVADATGPVGEYALDALRELSVAGSGEGVPTLAGVYDALPADVGLNAELKEPGTAADAVALVADRPHDARVSSFHPRALDRARARDPSVPRALLFAGAPDRSLDLAADLDCEAVHPEQSLCVGTDLVERAHDRGFGVCAWTVETAVEARKLRQAGVDGIVADYSDVCDGPTS